MELIVWLIAGILLGLYAAIMLSDPNKNCFPNKGSTSTIKYPEKHPEAEANNDSNIIIALTVAEIVTDSVDWLDIDWC